MNLLFASVLYAILAMVGTEIGGCAFAARCFHVKERCRVEPPQLERMAPNHDVACFYPLA